jgi:hypothetical protein
VEQPLLLQMGATLYLQLLPQPAVVEEVPVVVLLESLPEQQGVPVVVAPDKGLAERHHLPVKGMLVERGAVRQLPMRAAVVAADQLLVLLLPIVLVERGAQVRTIPQHSELVLE